MALFLGGCSKSYGYRGCSLQVSHSYIAVAISSMYYLFATIGFTCSCVFLLIFAAWVTVIMIAVSSTLAAIAVMMFVFFHPKALNPKP